MNNAEVLIKFKGDTIDLDSKTNQTKNKLTDLAKSFTVGALATKGITKAISVFNQGLDGAISRVDTMNNFPKVMSNLGISAQDASYVVKDLSEKLKGLPTSLDKATQSVQRLTTKTGDVKEAEKIFLALNNAILAGGASSDIQAQAMEQISQAFAKGKPDMMEWRSMMTAFPAQLKQVATAMGYVSVEALGEAVRSKEGAEEFSRMIETMTKMNQTGVNGFKSFEEQARNATGGISTSVANMKTAITRGIAEMISKVNESTQQFGGISGILGIIGKIGESIFKGIGNALSVILPIIISVYNWCVEHELIVKAIAIAVGTAIITFKTITGVISIINTVKTAVMALNAVMMANPIALVIALIVALVATFVYLWNHCEAFREFWVNLCESIVLFFANMGKAIVDGAKWLWEAVKSIFNTFIEILTAPFKMAFEGIKLVLNKLWEAIKWVAEKIFGTFGELPGKMLDIGKNIINGIVNGIKGAKDKAVSAVKNVGSSILSGIKGVLGIHSPSTEFGIIGKYSVLGYTEALDNMQSEVDKAINSTFGLSPNLTNSAMLHYSPNVVVNNNVEVNQDPLGQMVSKVKSYSGGAKNDYNFGLGN